MTKTIKVDCDKWENRLVIGLKGLGITLWSLTTFGLVWLSYTIIQAYDNILQHTDIFFFSFLLGLSVIGNIANLYFVIRTIYRRQNLFKFECSSGSFST